MPGGSMGQGHIYIYIYIFLYSENSHQMIIVRQ
jgi:hypothetical protein